jgi:putative DNA primase/helicase
MQEHNITPNELNNSESEFTPNFDFQQIASAEQSNILPVEILEHASGIIEQGNKVAPHEMILHELIEQLEILDFKALAAPHNEADFTLKENHFLILSIENVLQVAANNRWGLCKNQDFIYLYNGMHWAEIDEKSFQKFLGEAAEKMGVPIFQARLYLFREKLFKQFLETAYLTAPEGKDDKVLINLMNGTFEITPQERSLRPFDHSDFLTYQLPFEYAPQATAPIFEDYLNRVLPDKERQKVLAEYLGYVFIKHGSKSLKEEKALVLYGSGANGKSVFFEIVNALVGSENISSFSLQSLTNENGYSRAKLSNKLLNYASEINGNLEASIFKQLVSGEPVEARLPYGHPFMVKQYAKLIFNCNGLPKDVEQTDAYFRRFLIIPFDVTIPALEQDRQLHTKIIDSELSGVFNWVLEGLNRLLEQKRFSECGAAQRAVEQYRIESDSVLGFLNDQGYKPTTSPTATKGLRDFYTIYKNYCNEGGFKPVNERNFSNRLKNAGFEFKRSNLGMVIYVWK